MAVSDTKWFKLKELEHPEIVNQTALELLSEVREQAGQPLVVTDDGRLPGEIPTGASPSSLHPKGQAFDLRTRNKTAEEMWRLLRAVFNVADWICRGTKGGVEVELVSSATDHHLHIGFFLGSRSFNTFVVRTE